MFLFLKKELGYKEEYEKKKKKLLFIYVNSRRLVVLSRAHDLINVYFYNPPSLFL